MRLLALLVALLLAAGILAGCIGDSAQDPGSDVGLEAADWLPYLNDPEPDHDHKDPAQHEASWNLELVGHSYLADDPVMQPAWINQVVARDGFVYISAYRVPPSMDPGLIVLNATDPTHPTVASVFTKRDVTPIDIFLSDDGRFAFLAGHWFSPDGRDIDVDTPLARDCLPGLPTPKYKELCVPRVGFGVYAVHIEDPHHPHFAGQYLSQPSGAHTVKYGRVTEGSAAGEYLFLSSYGFSYFDRAATALEALRIVPGSERITVETPQGDLDAPGTHELEFVPVSRYLLPPVPVEERTFVHDSWFAQHPDTGQFLLYVAGWDGGLHILDYSNPVAPMPVAVWDDYDVAEYGNIHSVVTAYQPLEGTYYMVVSPEYGEAPHAGKIWTVDITNPAAPATLGEFVVPGDPISNLTGEYMYSPHSLDIHEHVIYHGHNHAGVWALDVSSAENLSEPKPVGVYFTVPPDEGVFPQGDHVRTIPSLWNVWMDGGLAFASDRFSGVYILELAQRHPGEPPWTGLALG